jgi:hypothetical protein
MRFWLVVGLLVAAVLVWAAISDRRARRYHRLRSHSEMGRDVHEHVRDARAAEAGLGLEDQTWVHRPGSSPEPRAGGDEDEPR